MMDRHPQDSKSLSSDGHATVHRRKHAREPKCRRPDTVAALQALQREGRTDDALAMCRRLLALQPHHVDLLFIQAELQQAAGQIDAAIGTYRRVLSLEPGLAEAEYNLGLLYQQTGEMALARDCYRRAIDLYPDFAPAHTNLGALLMEQGSLEEAAESFATATRIEPEYAGGHINRGRCLHEIGRYADAAACYLKATSIDPGASRAWHHLGLTQQKQGQLEQALQSLMIAVKLAPRNPDPYFAIGNVYLDQGNMPALIQWYRQGVAQCPDDTERRANLALLLHQQGHYEEALACWREVVKREPLNVNAHFDSALLLLRSGKFEQGWLEYEWRLKHKKWKQGYPWQIDKPRWQGENFEDKTLLVHCEQGYGDCLQFARYLPLVKSRGGSVIFEVPAAMAPLFRQFPGIDELWALSMTRPPDDRYDIYCPLLSLPRIFRTTAESIPELVPHQYASVQRCFPGLPGSTGGQLRVGIAWAGSKVHVNDMNRSCPLEHFVSLTAQTGVRVFSLQAEIAAEQIRVQDPTGAITHWGDQFEDFGDTAAAIDSLDLIITVDTAVAHLAGTMRKPTWLLLPFVPDWRWQAGREDSPWYPTMRLFRQSTPGDWPGVFEQVRDALDQFVRASVPSGGRSTPAPDSSFVHSALASAGGFLEKENYQRVEQQCCAVLETCPDQPQALFLLGVAAHRNSQFEKAESCYRQALAACPGLPEVHYNLGNLYLDRHRFQQAEEEFSRAIELKPEYLEARFNLGIALMEQRSLPQAARSFEAALHLDPRMVAAHYNLGCVYHDLERLEDAISCFRQALALEPAFVEACNNLGNAYLSNEQLAEAEIWFRKATEIRPEYADGHYNLGKVLQERREFAAAIESYRRALATNPAHGKAMNNTAKIYQDQGQVAKAIDWYRQALAVQPEYAEARFNLATAQLLSGDWAPGWQNYEWRFRRRDWRRTYPHRFNQPRWDGRRYDGKTLYVHSEQGLGDILQFVRYLPLVKRLGGRLVLETTRPMVKLFRWMKVADEVVETHPDGLPAVDFDYYIPLLSLPAVFNTTLDSIPDQVPYLAADPADIQQWAPGIEKHGLRIGLVWAGSSTDPRRACPLAWFTPLTQLRDVHFYGLQKGIAAEQIEVEGLPKGMRLINLGQEFRDFADTAAVIAQMDLVISIDTSVAHLAGAMGKPLWLMLPDVPDWRWLLDRNDSPWYPTARLFRQQHSGQWQPVIQSIANELMALIRRGQKTA